MKLFKYLFFVTLIFYFSCKRSTNENELDTEKLKIIANTYGQYAPDDAYEQGSEYAYYGSENEWTRRQFSKASADRLYKRRGQRQLLEILDKNFEGAIELTKIRLEEDSTDAESYYIQAIAYSKMGKIHESVQAMKNALSNQMSFSRFMAGPRVLFQNLYDTEEYKIELRNYGTHLIHGPMLGNVTHSDASFWVRTYEEDEVEIKCFKADDLVNIISSAKSNSSKETDFTAVVNLNGLSENTEYVYKVYINGNEVTSLNNLKFSTYPIHSRVVSIGFGGGAGYTPQNEKIWKSIASHRLNAMLLLGDNVYIDIPEEPGPFHDYTYYRRQSQSDFANMISTTPIYSIWDDHDAATDDVWLGPYVDKPTWKMPLLNVFKRNWNNPRYGAEDKPACWFNFSISDVDFFMLDGRTYRTNPFKEEKTMLGPVQKAWLLNGLKNSKATFKIIVSPVPWSSEAKPGSNDTWNGFVNERQEIYQFLSDNDIQGVVLLSADRHRTDFWKNNRDNDYPLYEFMSSRLTNIHTHDLMPEAIFGYNEKCSFGKITFNLELEDPEIKFEIINIDNEPINSYVLRRSELK